MAVEMIPPMVWTGREDPEDGDAARRMYHYAGDVGRIGLLGFACDAGVKRNKGRIGAAEGPAAIRRALSGMAAPVNANPFVDLGDVGVTGADLEVGQMELGRQIASHLEDFERMIVFGGGHETAYGSYLGLRARFPGKQIGIINLDAHLDIRMAGESGPSSGTPFAQIRALDPDGFDYLCIGVAEESNTVALFERATDWGIRIVMDHVLAQDANAADAAITALAQRCDLLYLTIDLDVLPHYQAPGVSAPAVRGVAFSTIEHLVRTVLTAAQNCPFGLPLFDIVELSPPNDVHGISARSAATLVRQMMQI